MPPCAPPCPTQRKQALNNSLRAEVAVLLQQQEATREEAHADKEAFVER